jgi:hypothetical protein
MLNFRSISIEWETAIDKYELSKLSPTSWAGDVIGSRPWGARLRLYAEARFAGWLVRYVITVFNGLRKSR